MMMNRVESFRDGAGDMNENQLELVCGSLFVICYLLFVVSRPATRRALTTDHEP
jgi:hypothetical protein